MVKRDSGITVVLTDKPENILERLRFYDIDTQLIDMELTAEEKKYYLKDLKKDITYFKVSYKRADLQVDISGLNPDQSARKVIEIVGEFKRKRQMVNPLRT